MGLVAALRFGDRPVEVEGLDDVDGDGVLQQALDGGDAVAAGDEDGGFRGLFFEHEAAGRPLDGNRLPRTQIVEDGPGKAVIGQSAHQKMEIAPVAGATGDG